jgi:hypothetical protein
MQVGSSETSLAIRFDYDAVKVGSETISGKEMQQLRRAARHLRRLGSANLTTA